MKDLFKLILGVLASLFKSRAKLEAEILILRQQINVLRRRASKRPHLNNTDRFLFVWLYRWFPSVLGAIAIIRPETIIRWHRAGFQAYWRWRSRNHVGKPKVSIELRTLIGEMSRANPLWGAPHIHGELLKLGFEVAQSTVARYMCRHSRPPSQGWRTFLSNHADGIAAVSPKSDQILRSGGGDNSGAEQASRLQNSITIKCLRLWEREWRRRVACSGAHIVMAALFKYFVGIAVILPAVMILYAVNMGEMFVGFAVVAQAPAAETPRWNVEHVKAEPDTPYVAHGSLSPIYPATPGKELLGKPVYTARLT